jgi:hypothetical protein
VQKPRTATSVATTWSADIRAPIRPVYSSVSDDSLLVQATHEGNKHIKHNSDELRPSDEAAKDFKGVCLECDTPCVPSKLRRREHQQDWSRADREQDPDSFVLSVERPTGVSPASSGEDEEYCTWWHERGRGFAMSGLENKVEECREATTGSVSGRVRGRRAARVGAR